MFSVKQAKRHVFGDRHCAGGCNPAANFQFKRRTALH
jgi:hypothetical protein